MSASEPRPVRRRLVAYDGSWSARRALVYAAELHRQGDGMAVICVAPEGETRERLLDDACGLLAVRGIEATRIAAGGDPSSEICTAAEREGFDTILVGRRNLPEGGVLELGAVAARVVAGAVGHVVVVA